MGVTGYPLRAIERLASSSNVDVLLSYNHYSLNDTSLVGKLPSFHSRGLGIINAGALSQGLLTEREAPSWHPAPEEVTRTGARAALFCRQQGSSLPKLAIQFSTRNEAIAPTVIGTPSPVEFKQAVKWADSPIDLEMLSEVQDMLAPIKDLTWISGRPENN